MVIGDMVFGFGGVWRPMREKRLAGLLLQWVVEVEGRWKMGGKREDRRT